ncbi:hypothetical protein K450DRAFT_231836 [Umbelopsis ramanniana AG]|uniref:FIST domain-containing protein n=1 Tax=Umbelopsis ramanniana AG TaxID=1314678 RepID=A0AAD5EDX9_UMBRA|nr:uncharacterized protein K450DRAFT_231836 [Umbelopsis ramanniana AG]KAI8581547.1 hypothetical protein K450DRAFT_231836 [Umbelopsis ramanniana AG]
MLSRYARVNPAKAHIRNLWTQRTASRSELAQAVAVSVADLPKKPIDVCVALVSQSFPANDLLKLNTEFFKHINPKIFIGAVVDRVPSPQSGGHDATAFVLDDTADRKKFKSVSVGRWGKVQDFNRFKYEENDIEKFGWDAFKSVSTNVHGHDLLPQLQNLKQTPKFAWILSDHEPYQLIETLDYHFPQATKAGLIGASTPFITGTPYTLFYNEKMLPGGSIGFVSSSVPKVRSSVQHIALEALGSPMTVTRCRGNIILDLDETSATGLLLDLLNKGHNAKISKDKEFYLGACTEDAGDNVQLTSVHRVTSGDPSKGNMSIDTTKDFQVGQKVQFLHRVDITAKTESEQSNGEQIVCTVAEKDTTYIGNNSFKPDVNSTTSNVFGGSSENGILVGQADQTTYVLDAPHSEYTVKIQ